MRCVKTAVVLLLAVLLTALPVSAALELSEPTTRFFVNDFADVMDSAAEDAVYAAGVQLYEKTGAQAVVVTVESLDGAAIEDYSLHLGRKWGIGDDEKNTGVLLLLAVEDRDVRIEVGYGLEGAITDMRSGILLDNYAIPYFAEDDFETGLQKTYDAIVNEVYLEFGLEADPDYVPADDLNGGDGIMGDIGGIALAIVILALLSFIGGRGFPLFIGSGFRHHSGGGFHHHGGGGFGGGGFRGGGGSFGGGGASRRF